MNKNNSVKIYYMPSEYTSLLNRKMPHTTIKCKTATIQG